MVEQRRVLLVEDDAAIRSMLTMLLEDQQAYAITLSADGADALKKARATPPDVVVLDMALPKVHGFEVARRMKEDPSTRHAWIVGISANRQAEAALAAGCDAFVPKPIDIARLEEEVLFGLARRARPGSTVFGAAIPAGC